jgi:cytochrome c oxidase subunit I+III
VTSTSTRGRSDVTAALDAVWSSKSGVPGFLSAVSHKQIGMRFIWTGMVFLLVGGVEGLLLRIQLARAENTFLGPEAYNQVFTMHGTTMMFLFAVPVLEGLAMYFTPLQVGTRDLPLPRLNALGYWLYLAGGLLLNWSLVTGSIPDGGWFAYVPLTGPEFSPSRALDYWLLGVTFVEISGIIGAIELVVVILRFRAPGMSLGRIPLFVWSVLVMAAMILVAFPYVVAATILLELERKVGAPFYDVAAGGNPLLWQHLFWIFGHPEVYIMLLPAIGMVSTVVAAHVGRPIVAYPLVVASLVAIGVVSFGLWVHHMFAVGLPVMVLSLFAVASYAIAIPSGIQVFAWIATIWEGRPRWTAPMWFVAGTVAIFVLGGITGVMVATAPWDLQAHDTFFVVAHFHYVLIGGVVFPMFAGLLHWFPKLSGRRPDETVGKLSCGVMFVGFNVAFFPQHWLGLQGMARRVYTYDRELGWGASNMVSTVGAFVLAAGFVLYFAHLAWAWRRGAPAGDDPWHGDTLEWSTVSPPPFHNFDVIPTVGSDAPGWEPDAARSEHFDRGVLDRLAVTGDPSSGRREVVQTSVVDARPERIVTLHGPSYWPLLTTVAFTFAMVGILVDWIVLAAGGAAAVVGSVSAWAVGNVRARTGPSHAGTPTTFPDLGPLGRGPVWWAAAMAMTAAGVLTSALLYAYVYLSLDDAPWPPNGVLAPIAWPLLALGAVVVGGIVGASRSHRIRTAAALLVAAGVAVQLWALRSSDQTIDRNAYEAIVITLEAWSALIVATAAALRLGTEAAVRGSADADSARECDRVVFPVAVVLWVVVWLVIHVAPRWT